MEIINEYVNETDWRLKQNANASKSMSGLRSHIVEKMLSKDALDKLGSIGKGHVDGRYHIHDLSGGLYSPYCSGNDLMNLLQTGLINVGNVNAKPARHFSTAINQIMNYTFMMTNEFMGAQAWSDIDVKLAPYVANDHLTYDQVRQEIQQLIWNLSFSLRPGFQSVFSNLTFGLRPSKYYDGMPVMIAGVSKGSYSDYQDEIDMINHAFLDIMIAGPGEGKPFTFPLPTYNITKDFDFKSDISQKIFTLAAKWGTPYFANYLNTDLSEDDSLSMCCRLRLDTSQIQKVTGGIWNFGSNTGSLAVFTINMARLGYLSNRNILTMYNLLDKELETGYQYLIQKKTFIMAGLAHGLFPMIQEYIGNKLAETYFLTVGINGLNECFINMGDGDITMNTAAAEHVLEHIKQKVFDMQKRSGQLFNFEASPAESASYSLAKLDKKKYPDIFTQGVGDDIYYTGSSLIPSGHDISLDDALRHQEKLQRHYTGGTVFHIDIGEMGSPEGIRELIQKTCTNTSLPYITWSPSYSICPIHGKTGGKGCCDQAEVYSRVVGYIRPVSRWNNGKQAEFKDKHFFR